MKKTPVLSDSAPQMWQTDAHRLIRDRHRRQILNRLRQRQRGKDENDDILDHGAQLTLEPSVPIVPAVQSLRSVQIVIDAARRI